MRPAVRLTPVERVLTATAVAGEVLVLVGAALALLLVAPGSPGQLGTLPVAAVTAASIDAEAPPPRRLAVPRLGIDTDVTGLRVLPSGELEVPADFDVAGWHRAGAAPGDVGPAVVVGHVDSYEGPAVFFRLRELVPGDRVFVARTDGSLVEFEVYGLETVGKGAFPTERVYGPTDGPELRLVTCGGPFDRRTRSYTDNVVAYARQVG